MGISQKPPPSFKYPPHTKAGAGSAGRVCWSIPTFRGPGVAGLSIIFRFQSPGPQGFAPPPTTMQIGRFPGQPLKSDWGFCRLISSPSSVFLFLTSGPPPPDSPSPPHLFAPPSLLSPQEVIAPFRHFSGGAQPCTTLLNNHVLQALGRAGDPLREAWEGRVWPQIPPAAPQPGPSDSPSSSPPHPSPVPAWECLPGVVIKWG